MASEAEAWSLLCCALTLAAASALLAAVRAAWSAARLGLGGVVAWSASTTVCAEVAAACATATAWALIALVSVRLVWALFTFTWAADTLFWAEVRVCAVAPALSWVSLACAVARPACACSS